MKLALSSAAAPDASLAELAEPRAAAACARWSWSRATVTGCSRR